MMRAAGLLDDNVHPRSDTPATYTGWWRFPARIARWGEPLWVGALILVFVIRGIEWIPAIVRMAGRGGQIETAEWLVYLLLGSVFPLIAAAVGLIAPRRVSRRWLVILVAALSLFALVYGFRYLSGSGMPTLIVAMTLAASTTAAAWAFKRRTDPAYVGLISAETMLWFATLSIVWGASLRIATWMTGAQWISQSLVTPVILALLTVAALKTFAVHSGDREPDVRWRPVLLDIPALLVLTALSFRTNPIAEFYHWAFWVGPIESVRQGGWLLWDVPSQYGFLSILTPALVPAPTGWVALYIVQSLLYAIVAAGMFLVFRSFRRDHWGYVVAFGVTAATVFFRPRSESLILAAQMTPAGGPMRFFWCYVLLGVLLWKYQAGDRVSARRFAVTGTVVWVMGVAWSVESAIYCSGVWIAAYVVFVLQQITVRERAERAVMAAGAALLPIIAVAAWVLVTSAVFRVFDGHLPDWMSYLEYALLFSGGYSALPMQSQGAIGYLLVVFALVSTSMVYSLRADLRHPRVMVGAGAWGCVWAISSYFVSRSHPVNLLSLTPVLLSACAVVLYSMGSLTTARWGRLARLVIVPLVAMPVTLSFAHPRFLGELARPQTAAVTLPAQIPPMDSSLFAVVRETPMKPGDPVFYVADGRFTMPPWPATSDGTVQTSETSWMPKPYEMIGTLPQYRRDLYIERFTRRMQLGGWLIQKKSEMNPAYATLLEKIAQTHQRVESHVSGEWIVDRYALRGDARPR